MERKCLDCVLCFSSTAVRGRSLTTPCCPVWVGGVLFKMIKCKCKCAAEAFKWKQSDTPWNQNMTSFSIFFCCLTPYINCLCRIKSQGSYCYAYSATAVSDNILSFLVELALQLYDTTCHCILFLLKQRIKIVIGISSKTWEQQWNWDKDLVANINLCSFSLSVLLEVRYRHDEQWSISPHHKSDWCTVQTLVYVRLT